MRVFLDECVDRNLARHFAGHDVATARQMRWTSVRNGALLALVAAQFDVFVTVDRNMAYQQNLEALPLPVVLLRAHTNRLRDLVPLMPAVLERLAEGLPKGITVVGRDVS